MNGKETLQRKIILKRQARGLILQEIHDLQIQLALLKICEYFESQISEDSDPILSRKIDCINYLLENA